MSTVKTSEHTGPLSAETRRPLLRRTARVAVGGLCVLAISLLVMVAFGGPSTIGGLAGSMGEQPSPAPSPSAPTAFPGPGNTGVPPGAHLTLHRGDLILLQPGDVVSNVEVHGCVSVQAPDVTLRSIRVVGACGIHNESTGLVVEDSTIDGGRNANAVGVSFGNYTLRRVEVVGTGDGARANGNVHIEDSWVHGLVEGPGGHNDGIQITEGSNITLRHNTVDNPLSQTSAIMIGADQGDVADVLVQDNLLSGGSYALYAGANISGGFTVRDVRLVGNQFSRVRFARAARYGPVNVRNDEAISMSGNVWQGTTTPVR